MKGWMDMMTKNNLHGFCGDGDDDDNDDGNANFEGDGDIDIQNIGNFDTGARDHGPRVGMSMIDDAVKTRWSSRIIDSSRVLLFGCRRSCRPFVGVWGFEGFLLLLVVCLFVYSCARFRRKTNTRIRIPSSIVHRHHHTNAKSWSECWGIFPSILIPFIRSLLLFPSKL